MTKLKEYKLPIILGSLFILALVIFNYARPTYGGIISSDVPTPTPSFRTYEFFASSTLPTLLSTTTSATSTNIISYTDSQGRIDNGYFVIAGAKKIQFFFNRTGNNGNAGASGFKVQVTKYATSTADNAVWYDFHKLVQATSTTQQQLVGLTGTSTLMYSFDNTIGGYYAVRCVVTEVTDGEHSCSAYAEY